MQAPLMAEMISVHPQMDSDWFFVYLLNYNFFYYFCIQILEFIYTIYYINLFH